MGAGTSGPGANLGADTIVLPRASKEAIPRPKLNLGDFLEFPRFLPDSSGIVPPKMEDC